jgi:hypothetical protein
MGIFVSQNPGIGGIDELTDSEALFIQQIVGGSKDEGDVLTISSGLPVWAAPSGGTKSIIYATSSTNQTSNLSSTNHIEFNTTNFSQGSSISLSTGSGQASGIFTLAANKTYRLSAGISVRYTTSTDNMRFVWRNTTSGTNIGNEVVLFPTTWGGQSENSMSECTAYITTSVSTTVVVYISSTSGTPVRINGGTSLQSYAEITEI